MSFFSDISEKTDYSRFSMSEIYVRKKRQDIASTQGGHFMSNDFLSESSDISTITDYY